MYNLLCQVTCLCILFIMLVMYNLLCQVTCLCILFIMLGDVLFIMSGNLFMYFVYNVG